MFENDETLLKKAKLDISNGRYNAAEKKLLKLINKKYKDAYYVIGDLYEHQNKPSQAVKYYQFAANDGNIDAMIKVGDLCSDRNNDNYNSQKALLYYGMGADNDNAYCLYKLGVMAANIDGKIHHYDEAISYLKRAMAIDASYTSDIAYYLGKCYLEEDLDTAMSWYEEAYHAGNMKAGLELVKWFEGRNEIDKVKQIYQDIIIATNDIEIKFKLAQLLQSDNKQAALSYYHQIIDELESLSSMDDRISNIYLTSLYELGNLYYTYNPVYATSLTVGDSNTNSDNTKAISFYEKAATLGHEESINKLTQLYQKGEYDNKLKPIEDTTNTDIEENQQEENTIDDNIKEYEKKANNGNLKAIDYLGDYYYDQNDYEKAFYWYEKALKKKDNYAMYKIGIMYYYGYGVNQSYQKANKILLDAQKQINRVHSMIKDKKVLSDFYLLLGDSFKHLAIAGQDVGKYAVYYYEQAAKLKDDRAMYLIGKLYYDGDIVSYDASLAFDWFSKAAKKGNNDAYNMLGYYYLYVKEDYDNAMHWFKDAIKQNHNDAMYNLGLIYTQKGDYNQAGYWFEQAYQLVQSDNKIADDDLGTLYEQLGYCYYYGKGVQQSYDDAYKVFIKAIDYGNISVSAWLIGNMYLEGHSVEVDHVKAIEYYEKAAHDGNTTVMEDLGYYYRVGKYVQQDQQKAIYWYTQSANKGSAYAMFKLGIIYGNISDHQNSFSWYNRALQLVESGKHNMDDSDIGSLYNNLANKYRNGQGTSQNYPRAIRYYETAINYGSSYGLYNIGDMYLNGEYYNLGYLQKDYLEARYYFEQAEEKGNKPALIALGKIYEEGLGVYTNLDKALEYYKKAYDKGYKVEEYERLKAKMS
ncbi:MAG: tetratricopeptide repeat protein [Erysipelotrichaceae bacterium]|nr:tetratricopeptide repeat protein [Erysipelotrichaceae bacterium]